MNNEDRISRVRDLIADISSAQQAAISHQENFKNFSNLAYGALQDYLKSRNMKTTDELVKEVIQALPPAEQQKILDHMKELSPKKGFEYLIQPSEIAKFMVIGWLIGGVSKVSAPYYYQAKAWWISYRSNALLGSTAAGRAVTDEAKALSKLSQAERQAFLDGLEAERVELENTLLKGYLELPLGAPGAAVPGSVEMSKTIVDIENSVKALKNVEAAEAEAVGAAGKITVWTKWFIAFNVVAIIGLVIYDEVKEKQATTELQSVIDKVATARLYASMSERMELVHTDQASVINLLATAFKQGDKAAQDFLQKNFADTVSTALTNITEQTTYDRLVKADQDLHRTNTGDDPSLDKMKTNRQAEQSQPLPDRKVNT